MIDLIQSLKNLKNLLQVRIINCLFKFIFNIAVFNASEIDLFAMETKIRMKLQ
jgi:hypothetical protein